MLLGIRMLDKYCADHTCDVVYTRQKFRSGVDMTTYWSILCGYTLWIYAFLMIEYIQCKMYSAVVLRFSCVSF